MRRAADFLAPLGLVAIVGALAWERSGRPLPGTIQPYLIGGAALILTHLVLRWEDVMRAVGRRQLRYGTNALVLTVVVLGIMGAANYLVYRHTKRWDLTKGQRFSLSEQTRKVVKALKDDVTIRYFQRSAEMDLGRDHLKEFQAASPRIKVEFVDPIANPGKAQAYDVRGPWPILVMERGGKREKISNDSEQDLANALIKVTRDAKKAVCFVEGEGERDIDDGAERGFSAVKSALGKSQYETQKVFLAREGKVPSACTVLVVAGPEKDLLPPAVEGIRAFVKGGGRAVLMVEPETKEAYPNLTALLKEWNVDLTKDVVVDISPMGQLFGTGPLTPLAGPPYPYHEITKDFRLATAFHTARSVEAGKATLEGVTAQSLVQTTPYSWAETDLGLKDPIEMNEDKDRKGPISLGAVVTIRASTLPSPGPSPSPVPESSPSPSPSSEESSARREGRVAAFGDSDFASNALLGFQGNRDFFLNTVAWLAEDEDLISIRPKEPDDQRMFLTRQQQQNASIMSLLLLPGLFVALGIGAWWRRRG